MKSSVEWLINLRDLDTRLFILYFIYFAIKCKAAHVFMIELLFSKLVGPIEIWISAGD